MRLLILLILFIPACATTESRLITPDGKTYRVYCRQDGHCIFKAGDVTADIDNRGRPSLIEQVLLTPIVGIGGAALERIK